MIPDFETISSETVGAQFKDKDVFFCTLGTTRRAAGSAVSHNCLMAIGKYTCNSSSLWYLTLKFLLISDKQYLALNFFSQHHVKLLSAECGLSSGERRSDCTNLGISQF